MQAGDVCRLLLSSVEKSRFVRPQSSLLKLGVQIIQGAFFSPVSG